ncbi:MAG: bifunctional metallophosphatase/5'-nucleotidase [Lachnospiraceae bacterium]|nr:bifunctional metallophosphatase/5'-nucleotidase [Lachnospiraceae bacterium]
MGKTKFDVISCNFVKEGKPVFAPYVIKGAAGIKIAFVGVTTPNTLTSSAPKYFQDETGKFIYGFMQDMDGSGVYKAVQDSIDGARTEGADLCTDAIREETGADIALLNGGGIRTGIAKGDVTYGDIISVHPFGNQLCVVEATGQQIFDALEWGARVVPEESGGFLQVSGMTYEIDATIPSSCQMDEAQMFKGVSDRRRVKNVTVGGVPINPSKKYSVAGIYYVMVNNGDGQTAFNGCKLLKENVKIDNQALIDYITVKLGGNIGEGYTNPTEDGRIKVIK